MSLLSKKERSAQLMGNLESMICPICESAMYIEDLRLICKNRHAFDIARQGYVNLLNQSINTNYNKQLFESRKRLITNTAFFTNLHEKISEVILNGRFNSTINVLDAGCGEGSHLSQIHHSLIESEANIKTAIGIDISKEGILEAAKYYQGQMWFVANLSNLPFKAHTFNIILNILSPANYREFARVLKPNGIVIKVVPQKNYLKELRLFSDGDDNHSFYSNEKMVDLFHEQFTNVQKERLHYQMNLGKTNINELLKMTPLTWEWSKEKVERFKNTASHTITIDFDVLIGRKDR